MEKMLIRSLGQIEARRPDFWVKGCQIFLSWIINFFEIIQFWFFFIQKTSLFFWQNLFFANKKLCKYKHSFPKYHNIIQPSSMCLFSLWKGQCQKIFGPPSQFVSRKTNPSCRVGNSLFGFLCESLIFWQKRELIALSLILKEQIALFALFVKSDKSD